MSDKDLLLRDIGQTLTTLQARWMDNMAQFSARFDLSVSDFLILTDIMHHPDTTMHELCARAGLKKSSVSRIIDSMVHKGFVDRTIPSGDRRTVRLTITESFAEGTFCSENHAPHLFKGIAKFPTKESLEDALAALKKALSLIDPD